MTSPSNPAGAQARPRELPPVSREGWLALEAFDRRLGTGETEAECRACALANLMSEGRPATDMDSVHVIREPEGRSAAEWDGIEPSPSGGISCYPRGGWWAVHGLEEGWLRPAKGSQGERLSPAGLARIGRTRTAPVAKPRRALAA